MPKIKHGMHKTKVYRHWIYMKTRCVRDPKYVDNHITVCPEWKQDFTQFLRDMGEPPTPKHTLDRIDGTRGYAPDNCRWATYAEQNRNLSTNVRVGDEVLADIAARTGLTHNTIRYRLSKGLPLEEAPIHKRTYCKAGHEWTVGNTYWKEVKRKQGGTRMQRYCRKCRAKHQTDLRHRVLTDLDLLKQLNPKRTT